jgi:geranylgeranyl reductase family protein
MTTASCEVLIVGGGPAGASTAFSLASRGVDVTLIDRATFPRPKPCAEYLSPEASRILHDMGALAAVEESGAARLKGVVVRAPNGARIHGEFIAKHGFVPFRDRGLSVRRELLDKVLIDRARSAGARVLEGTRLTSLSLSDGRITDVELSDSSNDRRTMTTGLVVGADGLRSVVARRLGLMRSSRWPRRLALVTHFEGVGHVGEVAEMHVERDGFVGIADVGLGVTTVALVVPAASASRIAGDAPGFLMRWLDAKPQLKDRFAHATRVSPVRATGPFGSQARSASAANALLVGDAADFFDPFTGEGIYAALRGGEMAADAVADAVVTSSNAGRRRALASYDAARRIEFKGKWIVERFVAAVVGTPFLINRAAGALSQRRDLADLLIGVTGDFVPAKEIVNARYVLSAFGLL